MTAKEKTYFHSSFLWMLHWGTNLTSTILDMVILRNGVSITTWFIDRYLPRHKLTIDIVHRSLMKDDCYGYLDATSYPDPEILLYHFTQV